MSISALLKAAKQHLESWPDLGLTPNEIEILPGPQPPPMAGERFLSLYSHEWQPGPDADQHRGLCERFGIGCTYTLRCPELFYAQTGRKAYTNAGPTLEGVIRKVILALHQNVDLIVLANTHLAGDSDQIQTYLRWQGCDPTPTWRDAAWFWSDPSNKSLAMTQVGFSWSCYFGQADRYQAYDRMA